MPACPPAPCSPDSFAAALRRWFTIGGISFGGPAGPIAMRHTELIDRRRWLDEPGFLRGLNVCSLLPGPEAQQRATHGGWRLHGLKAVSHPACGSCWPARCSC